MVSERQSPDRGAARLAAGIWRLADPKVSLASIAAMLLGGTLAAAAGPLPIGWLVLTVVGILALEVGKNASGEIFDFRSGTDQAVEIEDRSPFSGGKRVLVDGLLTVRQTALVAVWGYGVAVGAGLLVVLLRESSVLWLGVVGVVCALLYHAPPAALAYRGLGEIAVAVCYGPLLVVGTYLVLRGRAPLKVVLVSIPLGLLIGAFLWINEFPDAAADRAAGKRTMVVRLGKHRAARWFGFIVASAFLGLFVLPWTGAPRTVWLGFAGLPPALAATRRLLASPEETPRLIQAQVWTLAAFVLYSLGAGVGFLLAAGG